MRRSGAAFQRLGLSARALNSQRIRSGLVVEAVRVPRRHGIWVVDYEACSIAFARIKEARTVWAMRIYIRRKLRNGRRATRDISAPSYRRLEGMAMRPDDSLWVAAVIAGAALSAWFVTLW